MVPHFGSIGHAISGYLLATALGGDHRDPVMPDLPVLATVSGLDDADHPGPTPATPDLKSLDRPPV